MTCFDDARKRDDVTPLQMQMVEMAEAMVEMAKDAASAGDVPAVMGIFTKGGERGLAMVSEVFTEKMREHAPEALRHLLVQADAQAYVLMSESWMLPQSAMEALKAQTKGGEFELERPISQDDRRISIVSLNGESLEGDVLFAAFRIDEANGRAIDLAKEETFFVGRATDKTSAKGRLAGLLRKQEVEIELPKGPNVRNVVTRAMVREAAEVLEISEEEVEKITKARGLEIVEDVQKETILVCMTDDQPPQHDNPVERGQCSKCGKGIYYSPRSPKVGRRVCVSCAGVMAEEARG